MNLLFTICARAGSKGVKSKNSRSFAGYPIAYYTLSAYRGFLDKYAQGYGAVDLALNTDSEELLRQCEGTKLPFLYVPRREELGGDTVAKPVVIRDTLIEAEAGTGRRYDVIVDMDLTSPLRTVEDIQGCIAKLLELPEADVAYSVTDARRLPFFNMVKENEEGYMERVVPSAFVTRQQAPRCYDMNASLYAYRRNALLEADKKNVFDGKCAAWVMKDTAVLDIDSEEDYELLGVLAEYFYKKYPSYGEIKNGIPGLLATDVNAVHGM